jgi:hypothetical protein
MRKKIRVATDITPQECGFQIEDRGLYLRSSDVTSNKLVITLLSIKLRLVSGKILCKIQKKMSLKFTP